MNASRINQAVRDCLAKCQGTENPMGEVLGFLTALRRDPAWTDEEVSAVRDGVITMLRMQRGM